MILEILTVMTLFLWGLTLVPAQPITPYRAVGDFLAFIAVLLIALYLFVPALRG
jgi:hypothetical protein